MAKSIVITITKSDGTTLAEQKMVRPAGGGLTSVTFADLPIGAVIAKASAYPNVDGTGITQASASASVSIEGGKTATLSLTLVSAIDRLEVSPSSLTLVSGASAILQVVPKNSNGVIVLTDAANLAFSSSSSSIVTVDSAGKVTAGAAGDAEVTVSETESGKTASVSVRVTAPSPSPSPSTGGLNVDVK
ncbi:MAG: Ig-like domain-containing protein [Armatimonadota bacterium]